MPSLSERSCVPCRGGVPALAPATISRLLVEVPGWSVVDGHHLTRTYDFPDFSRGLAFVNRIGAIAEKEGHHPDVLLSYRRVRLDIWTHQIDGLTESDFILAAKADAALRA